MEATKVANSCSFRRVRAALELPGIRVFSKFFRAWATHDLRSWELFPGADERVVVSRTILKSAEKRLLAR